MVYTQNWIQFGNCSIYCQCGSMLITANICNIIFTYFRWSNLLHLTCYMITTLYEADVCSSMTSYTKYTHPFIDIFYQLYLYSVSTVCEYCNVKCPTECCWLKSFFVFGCHFKHPWGHRILTLKHVCRNVTLITLSEVCLQSYQIRIYVCM